MNAEDPHRQAVGLFLNARLCVLLHSNGPMDAIRAVHLFSPSYDAVTLSKATSTTERTERIFGESKTSRGVVLNLVVTVKMIRGKF